MRALAIAVLCCTLLAWPQANPAAACTSFVMDTPEGPVFGTNLDLFIPGDGLILVNRSGVDKEGYETSTTGERARWTSRYGSVTFNIAGREFVWGGMNEAGLVMSSMELRVGKYPDPDERPPLFDGNWGQYILDNCGTVEEVLQRSASIRVHDQGYTSQYLVADADGNAAVIEYLDGELVLFAGEELPVMALSNMRYERALYAYEHGGTRWWWSNPGQSAERFATCQARAEGFNASRDTSAVSYAFGTLIYGVAAPHTRWNIVFDIPNREVWYRTAQSPALKHISFEAFDFSCDAPKLMLDVNTPLEGDVDGHFEQYDPKVNLNVFRTFCGRFGIEVSEQDSASLTGFYDSFECAD
jgi:penicillin V acylase-like amidase (Ntn superfamily)